jgi:hypothetical protein
MFLAGGNRAVEEREMFRPSIMNEVCWQMMDLLKAKRRGTANPSARRLWELLEQWEQMLKEEESPDTNQTRLPVVRRSAGGAFRTRDQ